MCTMLRFVSAVGQSQLYFGPRGRYTSFHTLAKGKNNPILGIGNPIEIPIEKLFFSFYSF